jgi:hypothetical protein
VRPSLSCSRRGPAFWQPAANSSSTLVDNRAHGLNMEAERKLA